MKRKLKTLLDIIERLEMLASKALLVTMIAVVGAQVFFRYVLDRPLTWPEELCGFLLIWLTFLVADILVKRKGHVTVEFFFGKLSDRARLIISFLINLYIMAFLVFLVVSSIRIETLQIHHVVGAAMRIPKAYYTMAATWASASMLLSFVYEQWGIIRTFVAPTGEGTE